MIFVHQGTLLKEPRASGTLGMQKNTTTKSENECVCVCVCVSVRARERERERERAIQGVGLSHVARVFCTSRSAQRLLAETRFHASC